ncbi:MAG TPA: hypothetical protein VGK23_07555 [Methanomassiliicoccales archaeon]
MFEHYIHIKEEEWDNYRNWVTDWEVERYLKVL